MQIGNVKICCVQVYMYLHPCMIMDTSSAIMLMNFTYRHPHLHIDGPSPKGKATPVDILGLLLEAEEIANA